MSFTQLKPPLEEKDEKLIEEKDDKLTVPPLSDISQWSKVSKKIGGANDAGAVGGIYKYADEQKEYKALFKRESTVVHNITEAFTAWFLFDLAAENDKSFFPVVELAPIESKDDPDTEDNTSQIYLSVLFFEDMLEIYKDAHLANAAFPHLYEEPPGTIPDYLYEEPSGTVPDYKVKNKERVLKGIIDLPRKNPHIAQGCPVTQRVISRYRYNDFGARLTVMHFINNKDIHLSNMAAQGKANQNFVWVYGRDPDGEIKKYKVYEGTVNTVTYDYGWSLASERFGHKTLNDDLANTGNNPLTPIFDIFNGPFDYEKSYPDEIRYGKERVDELQRLYNLDDAVYIDSIRKNVDKLDVFSAKRLFDFAKYIGVYPNNLSDIPLKDTIKEKIKAYLSEKLLARKNKIPALIEDITSPHISTYIRNVFNYTYNAHNSRRSKAAAFLGASTTAEGNIIFTPYQFFRLIPKFIKNLVKIGTEFVPGVIEACGRYGFATIKHMLQKEKLSKTEGLVVFLLGVSSPFLYFIGKVWGVIGSLVTSPLRSANKTYDSVKLNTTDFLSWCGMKRKNAKIVGKILGGYGYLLSMIISIAATAFIGSLIAPYVIAAMGATGTGIAIGSASSWLANLPFISTVSSLISAPIVSFSQYFAINIITPMIAHTTTALSLIAITLISIGKSTIKAIHKYKSNSNNETPIKSNQTPAHMGEITGIDNSAEKKDEIEKINTDITTNTLSTIPSKVGNELGSTALVFQTTGTQPTIASAELDPQVIESKEEPREIRPPAQPQSSHLKRR